MLEVQPSPHQQDIYQISPVQCFEEKPEEESQFNSLAYYSYHSHLAAATETGKAPPMLYNYIMDQVRGYAGE